MITAAPFIKAEKTSCCANSSRTWGYYNRESLNLFSVDYAGGKRNCLILAHSWSPFCCLGEKYQMKGETAQSMGRRWGMWGLAPVSTWATPLEFHGHVPLPSCKRDMEKSELGSWRVSKALGNWKQHGVGSSWERGLLFRWDAAAPALNKELRFC